MTPFADNRISPTLIPPAAAAALPGMISETLATLVSMSVRILSPSPAPAVLPTQPRHLLSGLGKDFDTIYNRTRKDIWCVSCWDASCKLRDEPFYFYFSPHPVDFGKIKLGFPFSPSSHTIAKGCHQPSFLLRPLRGSY